MTAVSVWQFPDQSRYRRIPKDFIFATLTDPLVVDKLPHKCC